MATATGERGGADKEILQTQAAAVSPPPLYRVPNPTAEPPAWLPFSGPASLLLGGSSRDAILQPLTFPEASKQDLSHFLESSSDVPIPCLLCEQTFDGGIKARDVWLRHLLTTHKVVIHRTEDICSLKW